MDLFVSETVNRHRQELDAVLEIRVDMRGCSSSNTEFPFSKRFRPSFVAGQTPWVVTGTLALMLVAAAHFLWATAHEGLGVAGIVDGKYALESNGRIFKVLTREEYLTHRGAELRSFATIMIYRYFPPTMYWWVSRRDQPAN
jgi:hypothetical protein